MEATLPAPPRSSLQPWAASGTQVLPVSGFLSDRLLVTYRAPAEQLAALVPAPFELDVHAGFGFVSVCAVEILGMRIARSPRALCFDNREFLYRIGVRHRSNPTFLSLRSDVSSSALAWLGRYFSHYRPQRAQVTLARAGSRLSMACESRDGYGDAALAVDLAMTGPDHSVFECAEKASAFLLGMAFSADAVSGRVRVQPIAHTPWTPRFVHAVHARFAFLEQLERRIGAALDYDSTLAVQAVHQVWGAAHWIRD